MRTFFLVLLVIAFSASLDAQVVWLHDDFSRSTLEPEWMQSSGTWVMERHSLRIQTKEYDQLLASSFFINGLTRYTLQVTLCGPRAGVYFSLDDPRSKALSHMARFEGKSLLVGYFDAAGEYFATNTFDIPPAATDFRTLRIEVDPPRQRYALFVDGTFLGVDTTLIFASGYVGLQASEGLSEFTMVRITGDSPLLSPRLPKIGTRLLLQRLSYVATREDDLVVYDPACHALVRIDSNGTVVGASPTAKPPQRITTAQVGNRTFAIDKNRIVVSSADGRSADTLSDFLVKPACLLTNGRDVFVADPGARTVFQYTPAGRLKRKIDATLIGGLRAPRGLALSPSGELVIADYDRIVFWREELDLKPDIRTDAKGTPISLTWRSNASTPGRLELAENGHAWRSVPLGLGVSGRRYATFPPLLPLTRYSFRIFPTLKTIPPSASMSRVFRVATSPADPRTMMMTRLPLLCLVYRTISYRDRYPALMYPQIPDGRTLSEDDIGSLKQAIDFNRDFYFRNSACHLVLDFNFHVVEDTLWLNEVGASDPYWLEPNSRVVRDFEKAARIRGRNPEDYCGLIVPYAWINYPRRRSSTTGNRVWHDTLTIRQAVGGGTYGIPAPWKYGKSAGYTGNPFQDRFSRQDWLITHEFHHQIDALMELSGFPEYHHADQPWKMPGAFGEDFDFSAQIIRTISPLSWLSLKFGSLAVSRDSDRDGVPDNDPSLPFDEHRLSSDPEKNDTDGDGISDLAEIMAGHSRGSNPLNADTDADGLPDGADPEPLYAISPHLTRINNLDEIWGHPFGLVHDSVVTAEFFVAWTDSALVVASRSSKPVNLLCQIDARNDGWFHGFDNFQIRVFNDGDSAKVADFYLRDCSSWTNSPRDRRDILRPADLSVGWSKSSDDTTSSFYQLTMKIPGNDPYGLSFAVGKHLRLRLAVQTVTGLWVWNELFERNTMIQVELR